MTTLYIMVGAPGSGKSYFAKKYLSAGKSHIVYISRDEVRYSMINEKDAYFHISIGADAVIADATHLNWNSRRKLLNALNLLNETNNNLAIIPVVLKPNINIVLERNNTREGRANVPDDIVKRMWNNQTSPKTDPFNYTAIMEVIT